eukprot:1915427-Pleurochrysis_carterae.AAC.3
MLSGACLCSGRVHACLRLPRSSAAISAAQRSEQLEIAGLVRVNESVPYKEVDDDDADVGFEDGLGRRDQREHLTHGREHEGRHLAVGADGLEIGGQPQVESEEVVALQAPFVLVKARVRDDA